MQGDWGYLIVVFVLLSVGFEAFEFKDYGMLSEMRAYYKEFKEGEDWRESECYKYICKFNFIEVAGYYILPDSALFF